MQSLSSYLSNQADNALHGRIPAETQAFIRKVAFAEREMARDAGPIEAARRTLHGAYVELGDAYGRFAAFEEMARRRPGDGELREELARARAGCLSALEWLDDARLKMAQALRQQAEDQRQGAAA